MKAQLIALVSVFTIITSSTVFADTQSSLEESLMRCAKISSGEQRLSCYDNLTKVDVVPLIVTTTSSEQVDVIASAKTDKNVSSAINEKTILPVQAKSITNQQIDDFAIETVKKVESEKELDTIYGTISKLKQLLRGQWVIDLTNGQKWRQQGTNRLRLKAGDSIRLEKGSMGAIYLYKEGQNRSIRVRRLK